VRRLPPFHSNTGKRLVKSPKVYVRDTGVLHTLLGLDNREAVLGHPVAGGSWEGFVIEQLLSVAPERTQACFYRSAAGAEMDLVLDLPGPERWAIEVKRGLAAKPGKGFHQARADLQPKRSFLVYAGDEHYGIGDGIERINPSQLCTLLQASR